MLKVIVTVKSSCVDEMKKTGQCACLAHNGYLLILSIVSLFSFRLCGCFYVFEVSVSLAVGQMRVSLKYACMYILTSYPVYTSLFNKYFRGLQYVKT